MILSRHGVSVLYGLSAWGVLAISMFLVPLHASTDTVSFVTVRTRAPSNPNPRIWYRVPCDYRATPGRTWRTLVIFGGRNCGGSNEVSNTIDWAKWANDHGVLLVAPGFKDDSYWRKTGTVPVDFPLIFMLL